MEFAIINELKGELLSFCHTHADLPPLRLLHADRHAKELRVLCAGEGPTTTHGPPQTLGHTPSAYGPQICQFFFWGELYLYLFNLLF